MRKRWMLTAVSLFVAPALVFSSAPANAANPGIRSTAQYQALKSYVSQLNGEKNQQQTPAQISKYRSELSTKRARAAAKVRVLYQNRMSQAKDRRNQRKDKVAALKQRRNNQVAQLKNARQSRLNEIAAERRAAIARINGKYAGQQDRLNKQLNKARRKLAKATNPVVKQNLREEISAIQDNLDNLAQEKRSDLNVADNKYDNRTENAQNSFARRIENAVEQANATISNLQTRLREDYQRSKQLAQQRRADEFGLVRSKYTEGVGYINQMPVENNGQ